MFCRPHHGESRATKLLIEGSSSLPPHNLFRGIHLRYVHAEFTKHVPGRRKDVKQDNRCDRNCAQHGERVKFLLVFGSQSDVLDDADGRGTLCIVAAILTPLGEGLRSLIRDRAKHANHGTSRSRDPVEVQYFRSVSR